MTVMCIASVSLMLSHGGFNFYTYFYTSYLYALLNRNVLQMQKVPYIPQIASHWQSPRTTESAEWSTIKLKGLVKQYKSG